MFDIIIVGAGTAGCLLANRLSADPAKRVLLLEAGGRDDYHWIHIPVGYLHCIGNPRTDWLFQTEAEAGLNGRRLRYPRGKVLGGCSSINGMIYMRGQSRDYDDWARACDDPDWGWAQVLPHFLRHEDHWRLDEGAPRPAGFDPALHGHGGEWRVERQRLRWDILDAFAAAAQQAGIPASTDFNCGDNEGVGYFEVNQKAGWRWNTAKASLRPTCYARPNFEMWTGSQVQRLQLVRQDGQLHCQGVQVRTPQGLEEARLNPGGQVLLAAGAIGSPQLLQLSGLGPADLLQRHGIEVQQHLPGVGANLQDHLQIRAVFQVEGTRTLNTLASSWWGKARIGLEYALKRSGPMSMAPSQLGAFAKSDPGQPWPNLQYHVQPLSLDAFGEPLHRFNAFTASVCNLNPSSRGTVQIRSPEAGEAPLIAPN
jgi:choline dehydrogenase